MNEQDLRINIYFASEEAPHAPEGAGWYILATRPIIQEQGGYANAAEEILPRIRLDNKDILKLAKVIDKFVEGRALNWSDNAVRVDISLEKAVADATEAGREIVKQHLADAEEAVRKLNELRARVEEFDVSE